jgi:uncharacterized protein
MAEDVQLKLVQEDGRVFVDMPSDASNPCLDCGACCEHFRISFYSGELASVGGTVPDELTGKVNHTYACMSGTNQPSPRCSALQGTVGQPGIGCSIYHDRPSPCREFPVWEDDGTPNAGCTRARLRKGLPPLSPIAP